MIQKVPTLPHQQLYNTEDFLHKVNCTLIRISATGAEAVVIAEGLAAEVVFLDAGGAGQPKDLDFSTGRCGFNLLLKVMAICLMCIYIFQVYTFIYLA